MSDSPSFSELNEVEQVELIREYSIINQEYERIWKKKYNLMKRLGIA